MGRQAKATKPATDMNEDVKPEDTATASDVGGENKGVEPTASDVEPTPTKKDKKVASVKAEKGSDIEVYVVNTNVLHNGNQYYEGQELSANDGMCVVLVDLGYASLKE